MNAPVSTKSTVAGIFLLAALLGCAGGFILWNIVTYRVPSGEWRQALLAGEKAVRILGVSFDRMAGMTQVNVSLQTNQGRVYSCHETSCQQVQPGQSPDTPASASEKLRFTSPQPPGKVSDSLAYAYSGFCSGEVKYVILDDGSVWNWHKGECCETGCLVIYFEQLAYALVGLVVGFVVGYLVVQWRKSRHKATITVA